MPIIREKITVLDFVARWQSGSKIYTSGDGRYLRVLQHGDVARLDVLPDRILFAIEEDRCGTCTIFEGAAPLCS